MNEKQTKWPVYEDKLIASKHIFQTNYVNRQMELIIDTQKCKVCKQCVKACPRTALAMPVFPKGMKVALIERMPIMPDPSQCVYCGVCMVLCPFEAISMKNNSTEVPLTDLQLVSSQILPKIQEVKIRKVTLLDETFQNPFWAKILLRISE